MRKAKQRKKAMRRVLNRERKLIVAVRKQRKHFSAKSKENRIHQLIDQVKEA